MNSSLQPEQVQTNAPKNLAPNGILLIDKHSGITSSKILNQLKKKFEIPRRYKLGHAGTLDPMATGLLVCLFGDATKLSSLMMGGVKRYRGTILLGRTTSTDDIMGETLSESAVKSLELSDLIRAADSFKGEILQTPPKVSAVKIDGERAYKRARRGEDFSIKPRKAKVHSLEISPGKTDHEFSFDITTSPGFYVRSFARDLGEILGTGGCLAELRRVSSGNYQVKYAKSVEAVEFSDIVSWESYFTELPLLSIPQQELFALFRGDTERGSVSFQSSYSTLIRENSSVFKEQELFRFTTGEIGNREESRETVCSNAGLVERKEDGFWSIKFWDPDLKREYILATKGREK